MNSDRLRLKIYGILFGVMLVTGVLGFMIFEGLELMDSKDNYTYILSLAIRTNPFDLDASAMVT